jgi:hypothetical protein
MRATRFALPIVLATLVSCDYVEFPDNSGSGGGPGVDGPARKVLLEDFTGHTCNNCPAATDVAVSLHDLYGDDLIIVGVHCTDFALPSQSYPTDFRTAAGNEYESTFSINSLPAGLVSRRSFNNSLIVGSGSWGSAVSEIINTPADVEVLFDTVEYSTGTNTVEFTIKVVPVNDLTGVHNLTVYLTEDSVIDKQLDNRVNPPDVLNYVHRHVLRGNVNGIWGDAVGSSTLAAGDTITLPYTYTLPANVLDAAHCALVAYVYRTDTYEVLQVEEHKLQE